MPAQKRPHPSSAAPDGGHVQDQAPAAAAGSGTEPTANGGGTANGGVPEQLAKEEEERRERNDGDSDAGEQQEQEQDEEGGGGGGDDEDSLSSQSDGADMDDGSTRMLNTAAFSIASEIKKLNWFERTVLCMNIDIHKEQYNAYREHRELANSQQLMLHHVTGAKGSLPKFTPPLDYSKWNTSQVPWVEIEQQLYGSQAAASSTRGPVSDDEEDDDDEDEDDASE